METLEAAALARGRAGRQAEELAASHCALCSTVSPQAPAARLWR